jgi:hypothetical protein
MGRPVETRFAIIGRQKVSPQGTGSGIRVIQYFINRGGKRLSAVRKRELQKAKHILREKRLKQQHAG